MLNNFFNLKKILEAPDGRLVEVGFGFGPINENADFNPEEIMEKIMPTFEKGFKDSPRKHQHCTLDSEDNMLGMGPGKGLGIGPRAQEGECLKTRGLGMGPGKGLGIGPRAQEGECLKGEPEEILENAERLGIGPLNTNGKCVNTGNPEFLSMLANIKNQLAEIMEMVPKLNDAIANQQYIEKSNNLLDNILDDLSEDMYPALKDIEYDKINDIKEKIYNLKEILHSISPENPEDNVSHIEISTPESIGFTPKIMGIFKELFNYLNDSTVEHEEYECAECAECAEYAEDEECEECIEDKECEECDKDYPDFENIEIIKEDGPGFSAAVIGPAEEFNINEIVLNDMNNLSFGENPFAEEMVTILADLKIAHGMIKQSQKYNNVQMDSILLMLNPTKYQYIDDDIANDLNEIYADISDSMREASRNSGFNKLSYLINDDRDNFKQEFYISDWHPTETRKPNLPYNYQYWLKKVGDTHHKVMARLEEQKNPINKIMALRIPDGERSNPIREEVAGIETRMMRNNSNTSEPYLHNLESRMHGRNNKEQITTYDKKPKTSPNFNKILENKRGNEEILSTEIRLNNKRIVPNEYNIEGEMNKKRKETEIDPKVYEELLKDHRNENTRIASLFNSGISGFDNDMWGIRANKTNPATEETIVPEEQEDQEENPMNEAFELIQELEEIIKKNELGIELDINVSLNPESEEKQTPEDMYNNTTIEGKLSQDYANKMREYNVQHSGIDPNSAAPDIHLGNQMAEAIGTGAFNVPMK